MFNNKGSLLFILLGGLAAIGGALYFGSLGRTDDAETARLFMTHAAIGETAEAHALLHASITERHGVEDLAATLAGMETYTEITFPSFMFSTSNGIRTIELEGTGTTASGCESALEFHLRNGEITFFDITPLCQGGATDT